MMAWLKRKLVYWLLIRASGTWIGAPDRERRP
jgi:hypothetical protein